jgi:uncharacterized Zn-finger protein
VYVTRQITVVCVLTAAEQQSDVERVMEKAGGLRGGKISNRRCQVKDHDTLNGDSDRCVIGSIKVKSEQHDTSADGQSTQVVNKRHECEVCNKVFSRHYHLVRHHKIMHMTHRTTSYGGPSDDRHLEHSTSSGEQSLEGQDVYICDICGRACESKSKITSHMRTHTGEKPYACDVCKRTFRMHCDVVRHMQTHTGTKPRTCDVCKKTFSRSFHLIEHMRTHTGEKPHTCKVCERAFYRLSNLISHMRIHTGRTGERPSQSRYSCNVCKKPCSQRSDLMKHMRTHTSDKPYTCNVCKSWFVSKTQFTRHVRRFHDKDYD